MNEESSSRKNNSNPQLNIYNRYFYLRKEEHHLIQQQYEKQLKQLANKPKITVSSYQILCSQLQKNILSVFQQHSSQPQKQYQILNHSMNFMQFEKVIVDLTSIQSQNKQLSHFSSQLWLMIGKYELIPSLAASSVYSVMRILLDPYNLNEKESESLLREIEPIKNNQENRRNFLSKYPQFREEALTLPQLLKLWKNIRYKNPHFSTLSCKRQNWNEPTFHPEINQKSQDLAKTNLQRFLSSHESYAYPHGFKQKEHNQLSKYFSSQEESKSNKKISHFDLLHKRKLQKDMLPPVSMDSLKQQSKYRNEETVSPSKVKQIVNALYYKKQKKEDTDFKKIQEEQSLKKCTFAPKINDYYGPKRSISPSVRNYEKQVERMHRGRKIHQQKKQALENIGRVKNPMKKAPSFISRDAPKLILQIKIDDSKIEKLSLKGNENPHFVAKKFVSMHGLEDSMVDVLESLIDEQLDNL